MIDDPFDHWKILNAYSVLLMLLPIMGFAKSL